ncbi:MAG: hypothetical protein J6Y02_06590 [Pseudobutyrivibrio sp.]|nr:hypothetical protein [Pseudobutyrivibrio sp.]
MDQPIIFTPQDAINFMLALCGAIITLTAAITAITKVFVQVKKPEKIQNERLDKLEGDVKLINDRLENGTKTFRCNEAHIDDVEKRMDETNKIIVKTLQALTAHAIDGNNIEKLKSVNTELTDYLINQLGH